MVIAVGVVVARETYRLFVLFGNRCCLVVIAVSVVDVAVVVDCCWWCCL